MVQLGVDLDAAAPAAAEVAQAGGHHVPLVDVLLRLEPQLLHGLVDAREEADDAGDATRRVGGLVLRQHPVDVGVEVGGGAVVVALVVGLDELPGLVDVLLRHRPGRPQSVGCATR